MNQKTAQPAVFCYAGSFIAYMLDGIVVGMKHLHKVMVRILVAIVIGFLLAGAGTKIKYDCPSLADDPASTCISYEKALMHPADLLHNKQDSLVQFITAFTITTLVSVGILSVIALAQKKKTL